MQAMKFFLKSLRFILAAFAVCSLLSACGEKTPEQIAAERKAEIERSVRRSQVLLFENKAKDAISLLEKTNSECGNSPELCEALAYAYIQDGKSLEAAMLFEKASDLKSGNPEILINSAKSYQQSNDLESAARAYEKYLKIRPGDPVAQRSIAAIYDTLGKPRESLNALLAALKASGRNPSTSEAAKIGNLFVKVGNSAQARSWLEAAWAATIPENVQIRKEILAGLITVYLADKETALLEDAVKKIDAIDPAYIQQNYPNLRQQLDAFRKSLQEAQEALKAAEMKKKQEEEKAKAEAEAKAKAEAEAKTKAEKEKAALENANKTGNNPSGEFAAAIDEKPVPGAPLKEADSNAPAKKAASKFEIYTAQAHDALNKNDGKAAQKAAHLAISENRTSSEAWRTLAKAYEASGKFNDSYLASKEALSLNPDDINATLYYLRNASRVQSNEKFLNSLYQAHEKFPSNPEILIGLARTYRAMGDMRNAKFFYKTFTDDTPKEHPLYREISDEYEEMLSTGK